MVGENLHRLIMVESSGIHHFEPLGLELIQGYDAEHQVLDEARRGGEQHGRRETLAGLSLHVHGHFKLVGTVDCKNHGHAGYHGGQVLGCGFRAVAVQILQHRDGPLIGTDACGGDVRQLAERGQQFGGGKTGNDQRHLRLVTQQSSEFVVEAERGVDHVGHGLVHRIRNGPGDVVGHKLAGISGSLISRIIIRVGIGLR